MHVYTITKNNYGMCRLDILLHTINKESASLYSCSQLFNVRPYANVYFTYVSIFVGQLCYEI